MKKTLLLLVILVTANTIFAQFSDIIIIDSLCKGTTEICTGDINNDGLQDIILSKAYSDRRISFYLNLGNGNFGEEQIVTDEYFYYNEVTSADLNSDGFDDIITFGPGVQSNITDLIWFPNESGTFPEAVILDTNLVTGTEVKCSDLDNDGDIDVILDDDIKIKVYKNDGSGNFTTPDIIAANDEYYDFDVADLNGDGYNDIIASGGDNITILWNDTEGGFPTFSYVENPPLGLYFTIKTGDFDNDGDNDFALWTTANKLVWFSNDGEGNFTLAQEIADILLNSTLETNDVDLDGDLDLISATNQSSSVIWFENDGTGFFSDEKIIYQFSEFNTINSVYPVDLDNDGDEEVVWGAIFGPLAFNDNLTNTVFIEENSQNNNFYIYPNPATDHITIASKGNEVSHISIYGITGKPIFEKPEVQNGEMIDISFLNLGAYFVTVRINGESFTTKFIKVK